MKAQYGWNHHQGGLKTVYLLYLKLEMLFSRSWECHCICCFDQNSKRIYKEIREWDWIFLSSYQQWDRVSSCYSLDISRIQ